MLIYSFGLSAVCLLSVTATAAGILGTGVAESTRTSRVKLIIMRNILLSSADDQAAAAPTSTNRIGIGGGSSTSAACPKDNVVIFQEPTDPLPNGIPAFSVTILNVCVTGCCTVSDVHVSCGWFGSARLINPNVFRRICYDDCLVNNGGPIGPGDSIVFVYANSFKYPMEVLSVGCC